MSSFIDLTGTRFGSLLVVMRGETDHRGEACWICVCDCGKQTLSKGFGLRNGNTHSCGCKDKKVIHGQSGTNLYNIWNGMKMRCQPNYWQRQHYHDKGIMVCDRWQSFANFLEDMGQRPSPLHSVDRIDPSKGYSPDNCRWATHKEQSLNRANTRYLYVEGKKLTYQEVADKYGISVGALRSRVANGWPIERVLSPKIKSSGRSVAYSTARHGWVVDYINAMLSLPV